MLWYLFSHPKDDSTKIQLERECSVVNTNYNQEHIIVESFLRLLVIVRLYGLCKCNISEGATLVFTNTNVSFAELSIKAHI